MIYSAGGPLSGRQC